MAKVRFQIKKPEYTKLCYPSETYDVDFKKFTSYVNYEIDNKELVKSAKVWIKNNSEYDTSIMFSLSDSHFTSVGKFCYILNHGGTFSVEHMSSLRDLISDLYEKAQLVDNNGVETTKKHTTNSNIQEKMGYILGEIESWIDDFLMEPKKKPLENHNLRMYFEKHKLRAEHYSYTIRQYAPSVVEMTEVINGNNTSLNEGYSDMPIGIARKLKSFYENVVSVADALRKEDEEKHKKEKVIDKGKIAEKARILKEDSRMGLKSVNPLFIFGAKTAWAFDTKTRKLCVYYAKDGGLELTVNSIHNFTENSVSKMVRSSFNFDFKKFVKASNKNKLQMFNDMKSIQVKADGSLGNTIMVLHVDN